MKEEYEPSPDFVDKVMTRVYLLGVRKVTLGERLVASRPSRCILTSGGAIIGIFNAARLIN